MTNAFFTSEGWFLVFFFLKLRTSVTPWLENVLHQGIKYREVETPCLALLKTVFQKASQKQINREKDKDTRPEAI